MVQPDFRSSNWLRVSIWAIINDGCVLLKGFAIAKHSFE